jgi:predicted ATP-dependent Lon-type protease
MGTISQAGNLAETTQVAFGVGANRILLPMSRRTTNRQNKTHEKINSNQRSPDKRQLGFW